jgi:hypothetical protein
MPRTARTRRAVARLAPAALAVAAALPAAARVGAAQAPTRPVAVVSAAAAVPNAAPAAAPAAAPTVAVPEGTEFYVITTEALSSKNASEGQRVAMKVDENVLVNGVLVIAKGTPVRAEVNEAKSSGMFGKAGKLTLRIESTTAVDGQKVPLTGSPKAAGKSRAGTMVAVTLLVSPAGVFLKGKNATYPAGTRMTVYTDESVRVTPAAAGGQ